MDYNRLAKKTANDLFTKGYSCFIGQGIMVSISNSDYDNDYTLVIENNEGMATLDYGEKELMFASYYIAVCMAEKKVSFHSIEKTFSDDMYRETFINRVERWLKPKELEAIKGHNVFFARKTYYEQHKDKLLEYGREYRRKKKEAA